MDLLLERHLFLSPHLPERVSILVLLDLPLEPRSASSSKTPTSSFNPCFSGSASRTRRWVSVPEYEQMSFNPCFSGSASRTAKTAEEVFNTVSESFNPCFSGSASRTWTVVE